MSVNIFKNGILSKIAGAVGDAVPLINNFLTNQAGKGAADANTVYVLNNKIDELNSSLAKYVGYWIENGYLPDPDNPTIPFTLSVYSGRVTINNSKCYIYDNNGTKYAHVELTLYCNTTLPVMLSVYGLPKPITNTSGYDIYYENEVSAYGLRYDMTAGQTYNITFEYTTDGTF